MTLLKEGDRVCVIGLGNMSGALAEALVTAGWEVTAWNRSPHKSQAVRDKGVEIANSVASLRNNYLVAARHGPTDSPTGERAGPTVVLKKIAGSSFDHLFY